MSIPKGFNNTRRTTESSLVELTGRYNGESKYHKGIALVLSLANAQLYLIRSIPFLKRQRLLITR